MGMVSGNQFTVYPYARLADANGNPLALTRDYRTGFIDQAEGMGLLDWRYRPLEDLSLADNHSGIADYRINTHLTYKLLTGLYAELLYQFGQTSTYRYNRQSELAYFTRDLNHSYTQLQPDRKSTRLNSSH